MAGLEFRRLAGDLIRVALEPSDDGYSVEEARRALGEALGVAHARVRLVLQRTAEELADGARVAPARDGPAAVVFVYVLPDPHEVELARCCEVELFSDLSGWVQLSAPCHGIARLPDGFGKLAALTTVNLAANQLALLPESFGQLSGLTELNLDHNQLTSLPESFGELSRLTWLRLDYNDIELLPESFGRLAALMFLHLDCNDLLSLPESFGRLAALKELYLGGNRRLALLPGSFGQLVALRVLRLDPFVGFSSFPDLDQLHDDVFDALRRGRKRKRPEGPR